MARSENTRICKELVREIDGLQARLRAQGVDISKVAASRMIAKKINPDDIFGDIKIKFRRREIRL